MTARTLAAYELAAARTVNASLDERQQLLDACCGLAEEAGEVLAHVRKHVMQGRPLDRDALAAELGDALWCVAIAARSAGLSLDAVAESNVRKLEARHPEGFSSAPTR